MQCLGTKIFEMAGGKMRIALQTLMFYKNCKVLFNQIHYNKLQDGAGKDASIHLMIDLK
jgi:hypothetical protein